MSSIGGIIFEHIGDRKGRKKALLISILMMAIPTTLIVLLPTHASIGWYSALFGGTTPLVSVWLIKISYTASS